MTMANVPCVSNGSPVPPRVATVSDLSVDEFQHQAHEWLAANRQHAPRDYGAICPPDLVEAGIAWQRRIHAAGFGGVHWPVEYGGRGLSPEHNSVWMLEAAIAGVPPVLNMVGLVPVSYTHLTLPTNREV